MEREEVVITRHGKPAGVVIGFESEEDWFDYRLENDPRFLQRVESARASLGGEGGDVDAEIALNAPLDGAIPFPTSPKSTRLNTM